MTPVLAQSERLVRLMATILHDLVGRPFRWLIWTSPIRTWLQRTDPNSWSLVRLPLSFIIVLLLRSGHNAWAIVILSICLLTDRLDGELARVTKRCTPLGEKIDTFVDAAMMSAIILGLADRLPLITWGTLTLSLVTIIVSLEAARLLGGFLLGSWSQTDAERHALTPNLSGKYKMAVFGLAAFLLLFGQSRIANMLFLLATLLNIYSLLRHLSDWTVARLHRSSSI